MEEEKKTKYEAKIEGKFYRKEMINTTKEKRIRHMTKKSQMEGRKEREMRAKKVGKEGKRKEDVYNDIE